MRRPGRFDREFYFPLPVRDTRKKIIHIHTRYLVWWLIYLVRKWKQPPSEELLNELADNSKGYGGSDIKALCTEGNGHFSVLFIYLLAALRSLERCFPQIYNSETKLVIDLDKVVVERQDFVQCLQKLVPSSYRIRPSLAAHLPLHLQPLLSSNLHQLLKLVRSEFPIGKTSDSVETGFAELRNRQHGLTQVYRPRLLVNSAIPNNGNYLLNVI